MRTAGWEERLRVLDEAVLAFQVARRAAETVDIPAMEAEWLKQGEARKEGALRWRKPPKSVRETPFWREQMSKD
jgi:hypothetical protein